MSDFRLTINDMSWVSDESDDPLDLCLHGQVTARIGQAVLVSNCTLSAAGIYLLRTIEEDHIPADPDQNALYEPLLPCCGHEMYAGEDDSVILYGCGNGNTWKVQHRDSSVILTAEGYPSVIISSAEYRNEIYRFCDKIEAFYNACTPKQFTIHQGYEINGYKALWKEWHRRRNA